LLLGNERTANCARAWRAEGLHGLIWTSQRNIEGASRRFGFRGDEGRTVAIEAYMPGAAPGRYRYIAINRRFLSIKTFALWKLRPPEDADDEHHLCRL
jgi:hypothetical protein